MKLLFVHQNFGALGGAEANIQLSAKELQCRGHVVGLLHELGHIFGAEHVQDRDSIMYEDFEYRSDFDDKNREIILKNKFCPFGKG